MIEGSFILAGEVRPGHVISLTGLESDAALVTEIQPSIDYLHVEITLETQVRRSLPIELPLELFEE